jgi:hypothetical protein
VWGLLKQRWGQLALRRPLIAMVAAYRRQASYDVQEPRPVVIVTSWTALLTHCALISLFFALTGIGAWLLWLGSHYSTASCPVPLATYSVVDGAMNVTAGVALLIVFLWWHLRVKPSQQSFLWPASLGLAMLSLCALLVVILSYLGVKIWGTTLAFGDALWTKMHAATTEISELPCAPALYFPLAVFLIISWVAPVLLVLLALCVAITTFLATTYQKALDKRQKGEEAEPWAGFEGMRTNPYDGAGYFSGGGGERHLYRGEDEETGSEPNLSGRKDSVDGGSDEAASVDRGSTGSRGSSHRRGANH